MGTKLDLRRDPGLLCVITFGDVTGIAAKLEEKGQRMITQDEVIRRESSLNFRREDCLLINLELLHL